VYPDWQDETGVKMIIVSIDQAQDANKVKPLVDGFGWEYEVLLDPNGDFKRAMNVQNVPHVFVLDGKGKIVYNHAGYVDGGEEDIYEALL
jgi:thioredoxin-related protein